MRERGEHEVHSKKEGRKEGYDVLRRIIDHVTKETTEPLLVSSTTLSLIVRQFLGSRGSHRKAH